MAHLEATRCADYARGLGGPVQRAAFEDHLDSGCSRCGGLVRAFERVASVCAARRVSEPPGHVLRAVKAYFAFQQAATSACTRGRRLTRVFDSLSAPASAGVRGRSQAVRHLSYESGQYLVDLTIAQVASEPSGIIAGQILRQFDGPIVPLAEVPAFLLSGGELQATALTSEQGGFSLSGGLGGQCELWFFLEDERMIGVSWDQDEETATRH